jgi:hypothetical protein
MSQDISERRWPLQIHTLVASQTRYGEGAEEIAHKASCPPLPFPSSLHHLLWRSSSSKIFCVQYSIDFISPRHINVTFPYTPWPSNWFLPLRCLHFTDTWKWLQCKKHSYLFLLVIKTRFFHRSMYVRHLFYHASPRLYIVISWCIKRFLSKKNSFGHLALGKLNFSGTHIYTHTLMYLSVMLWNGDTKPTFQQSLHKRLCYIYIAK